MFKYTEIIRTYPKLNYLPPLFFLIKEAFFPQSKPVSLEFHIFVLNFIDSRKRVSWIFESKVKYFLKDFLENIYIVIPTEAF